MPTVTYVLARAMFIKKLHADKNHTPVKKRGIKCENSFKHTHCTPYGAGAYT